MVRSGAAPRAAISSSHLGAHAELPAHGSHRRLDEHVGDEERDVRVGATVDDRVRDLRRERQRLVLRLGVEFPVPRYEGPAGMELRRSRGAVPAQGWGEGRGGAREEGGDGELHRGGGVGAAKRIVIKYVVLP